MPAKMTFEAPLAIALEQSTETRERVRTTKALLSWASDSVQGIPTLKAIALNARVMQVFASVFCKASSTRVKAPPIAWVRAEVGSSKCGFVSRRFLVFNFVLQAANVP